MPMSRLLRRSVDDVVAVDQDLALIGRDEARDHTQRRRLAATRRAEKGEELARRDLEVDLRHRDVAVIRLGQRDKLDGCQFASLSAQCNAIVMLRRRRWR